MPQFLHIKGGEHVSDFKSAFENGKHIFVLVYMNGCGPCEATKPEWDAIESKLVEPLKSDNTIVIAKVDSETAGELADILGDVDGFPTIKKITKGSPVVDFNDARTADAFVSWIGNKKPPSASTSMGASTGSSMGASTGSSMSPESKMFGGRKTRRRRNRRHHKLTKKRKLGRKSRKSRRKSRQGR